MGADMQCINDDCVSAAATAIIETRKAPAVTYRVHRCAECRHEYTTIEVLAPVQEIPRSARKRKEAA